MRTSTPISDYYSFKEKKKNLENRQDETQIIFSNLKKRQEEYNRQFSSKR
jgi:hypothetical protein